MVDDIKVSVCMITYNHEPYIAQAVESVLAQRTTFPVEIIIGDDCSTDNTRAILQRLADQHPDTIHLQFAGRNRGANANFVSVFGCCRGKYVAMLEGDDYWTCLNKLQSQVEALDAHPEWAICFHPSECVYQDGIQGVPVYPYEWTKPVATIDDLFTSNFMATSSVVFRNRLFDEIPIWFHRLILGDWPLHILNAVHGDIGYLPETMSAYRLHRSGLWTGAALGTRLHALSEMFSAIDHHFGGKYADRINVYRASMMDGVLAELEAARNQVANVSEYLRNAQAVADAQTTAYAENHAHQAIRSGYLELDLIESQNERQKLLAEVLQLQAERSDLIERQATLVHEQAELVANRTALMAENSQLRAFHDTWRNWMFYRIVREMRRPFRRTSRWWKQRRQPLDTSARPQNSPVNKAA
jgi:glycosyltransferase involved in cell wall biosynthesis/FtsZ-binding cell division protein ZapB